MAVLSTMSFQGDPDDLLARMQATLDPVAARKAPQYGGISSTIVRTDDGVAIYNLWSTEEGRHKMADDPEIQAALHEAGFPEPHFAGYEVLMHRSAGELAKELAQRFVDEVWTQGRLDVIDELVSPDFVGSDPTAGETHGPAELRAVVDGYRSAFPDMTMRVDRLVAEGEWVVTHWTATGTHTGELMGIAPTGRQVTVSGVNIDRIADGRIAESRGVFDSLGMLQQIGAIPAGAAVG